MSYREAYDFLADYTRVIELAADSARVAVCPEWQARVMTSTCSGPQGPSFGFIHREFIEAGKPDERFNNYGGEERFWLAPEGGQFSLWFAPGKEQTLENWYTQPALNEGAWEVVGQEGQESCTMRRRMQLRNASNTRFDLEVLRTVRLLAEDDYRQLFGDEAAAILKRDDVEKVGYETINQVANRGPDMQADKGLVSVWILGMYNAGPRTVVIVPYRPGRESELGPVVQSDYFGTVPPERLKILPEAVLFLADSRYRSKIGTSQRRARNVLGSIDFQAGVLTLVNFTMPEDPAAHRYLNNLWELPQAEPYVGDVANAYNDGPNETGGQLGAFYEIESLSAAEELRTGESLEHRHRTVHVRAPMDVLDQLAQTVLGVSLEKVRQTMFGR